jgi:ribonuclease J
MSFLGGYLPDVRPFWDVNNVHILEVHCSGQKDLKGFVRVTNPKYVIPIHTFFPEEYSKILGCNVTIVKDGETVQI